MSPRFRRWATSFLEAPKAAVPTDKSLKRAISGRAPNKSASRAVRLRVSSTVPEPTFSARTLRPPWQSDAGQGTLLRAFHHRPFFSFLET